MSLMALFDHPGLSGLLSSSREVRTGQKSNFVMVKIIHECTGLNFYQLLYDSKTVFWCIFGKCKEGNFEKNPFQPKTTIFGLLRGSSCPKSWNIQCFQFTQSKISHYGTQMWLPKKLQFLVPLPPPLIPPVPA